MTDSEMTIRTMINGLKDIPKMTDKRQVARRVRGLILALKDLPGKAENKRLTKMCIRNAHQRDMALARLSRAARKNRQLEAKNRVLKQLTALYRISLRQGERIWSENKRLRASLAKKRKKT